MSESSKNDASHTPGPWESECFLVRQCGGRRLEICHTGIIGRNKPGEQAEADAKLIAAAPDMLEALRIVRDCGQPEKVSLYDEEGVEGWKWTHPDGREWTAIGSWYDDPPCHPVVEEAIEKAV